MGPNNWEIFLILPVTAGEGIGPAGGSFPRSLYAKKWPILSYIPVLIYSLRVKNKCFINIKKALAGIIILTQSRYRVLESLLVNDLMIVKATRLEVLSK